LTLKVKLAAGSLVILTAFSGYTFWLFSGRVDRANSEVSALRERLAEQEQKEAELSEKLGAIRAEKAVVSGVDRAARTLEAFIEARMRELGDPGVLGSLAGGWSAQKAQATKLLEKSGGILDQVVVINSRGIVSVVAPPSGALAGRLFYSDSAALRKVAAGKTARMEIRTLPDGAGFMLEMSAPFYGGKKAAFLGAVIERASMESVLKLARGTEAIGIGLHLIVADSKGLILYSTVPDLAGKQFGEIRELAPLAEAKENESTEINYSFAAWRGARSRAAGAGLVVYGLASLSSMTPSAGGSAPGRAKLPVPLFLAGLAMAVILSAVMVIIPFNRLTDLTKATQSLLQGDAVVDLKSAGAKDEVGAIARALERLGGELSAERARRAETQQTIGQLQQDLSRAQAESRELTEYQRDLETRSRREKEALDAELMSTRSELETSRSQMNELRRQLGSTQSSQGEVNQLQAQIAALRQSLAVRHEELGRSKAKLQAQAAGPVAGFELLTEASESLGTELSALLEVVQGYVGQMLESGEGSISDEQQEFLTTVINRSARSQRMLADLTDFARVKMPGQAEPAPIDFASFLLDVASPIQQAAEDKGLEFNLDIGAGVPNIKGDEARLRQLFTILLQNALRFTPEGGRVSLTAAEAGGLAEVRIEDGGDPLPGSAEDVFGRFHSVEEESLQLRNSGLRYPLMRSIAEAHGGGANVEPHEGGGNRFIITLHPEGKPPSPAEPLAEAMPSEMLAAAGFEASRAFDPENISPSVMSEEQGAFELPKFSLEEPGGGGLGVLPGADFSAFGASADLEAQPSADLISAALSAIPSPEGPVAGGPETIESILAALPAAEGPDASPVIPEFSSGLGLDDLWQMPSAPGVEPAPSIESIEAAGSPDMPPQPPAVPPAKPSGGTQSSEPFKFGSDELIQE